MSSFLVLVAVSPLAVAAFTGASRADEKLKGIACQSVHLFFPAPTGTAF